MKGSCTATSTASGRAAGRRAPSRGVRRVSRQVGGGAWRSGPGAGHSGNRGTHGPYGTALRSRAGARGAEAGQPVQGSATGRLGLGGEPGAGTHGGLVRPELTAD